MGEDMRKGLERIGLLALLLISFIYTEKTINVIKENDDLMIEIKDKSANYLVEPIEALVIDDTFIPGISGQEVDINKSYKEMKKVGIFTESLIVYKEIKPEEVINKNLDKYIISGNKDKNMVSLLFLIRADSDINSLTSILDKNETEASLFVDGMWLEANNDLIIDVASKYEIGNLSYDGDYANASFPWMDIVIKNAINQGYTYCLMLDKNKEYLDVCEINNNPTIMPNIYIKNNSLPTLKREITSGSLIAIEVNDNTLNELPSVISYIKSKGYNISNLKEHLLE